MAKFIAILIIALVAIPFSTAKNSTSISSINHLNLDTFTQGGILEFNSSSAQSFENSTNNCDSVILRDYTGLPLKALQLKIIVGNKGGKLKLNSLSRGSSIPASSFFFDYQIYRGETQADGSSIDEVIVVILGNGENVLQPKQIHQILCINYDVVQLENDNDSTSIELSEVLGATCTPVQDANISVGNEKNIYLKKRSVIPESEVTLQQNYPNPFNPTTKINYTLKSDGVVTLKIFDSVGQEISTLLNEFKTAGEYEYHFSANGGHAYNLVSGVYFYQVNSGSYTDIKKMILIK
ncbi:MAG: T9SS type A sorting domain-containing protein [Ignavibacteria bacterium]|nr:T9SS type A sorting domain-containing protein [Ignavibacteria bacterium]